MWTNWLVDFTEKCWEILGELAPWFLLGAIVAGLIHGLAFVEFVKQRLTGYRGVWLASLFGIPLPLCSCAVIPTGIGLRKSGASEGASIGFLISTPQTGVDSILVTAAFLGWPFAIFKLVVALILGTVAGTIVEFRERHQRARAAAQVVSSPPKRSLSLPVLQSLPAAGTESGAVIARRGSAIFPYFRDSVLQAVEIIRSIYLWIIVGVMISAALTTWLPMGSIQSWLGPQGSWLQTPVALLISVPLYVCATASVPVAAALVHSGLSVGATIVFLMAGPATNLATIGAIFRSFSRGAFVTYLVTIVIGSVAAALVFDELLTGKWVALPELGHEDPSAAGRHAHGGGHPPGHDHRHWLNQGSAIGLLLLFGWFAAQSVYRRWCGLPGGHDPHG